MERAHAWMAQFDERALPTVAQVEIEELTRLPGVILPLRDDGGPEDRADALDANFSNRFSADLGIRLSHNPLMRIEPLCRRVNQLRWNSDPVEKVQPHTVPPGDGGAIVSVKMVGSPSARADLLSAQHTRSVRHHHEATMRPPPTRRHLGSGIRLVSLPEIAWQGQIPNLPEITQKGKP